MATLSKNDTGPLKLAASGPYVGQTRFKVIQSKIKDKKPFMLGKDGKGGVIYGLKVTKKTWPYEISYTEKKRGTKPDGVVKATQIFKDPDFGGGGGSGGGAKDTEVTESLQCYYTSVLYNGTNKEWVTLTKGVDKQILIK